MLEGINRRSVQTYIEENLATGGGGKLANLRLMCLMSLTQVCVTSLLITYIFTACTLVPVFSGECYRMDCSLTTPGHSRHNFFMHTAISSFQVSVIWKR